MNICIIPGERRYKSYPWEQEAWIREAVSNPHHMEAILDVFPDGDHPQMRANFAREMGQVAVAYPTGFASFGDYGLALDPLKFPILGRIRSWFDGQTETEEEERVMKLDVPLCAFNCPDMPGARTIYAESSSTAGTAGWSIDVLGTGFGSQMTLSVSQTNTFTALAGELMLVFAPLKLRVAKVALYKHGVFQNRFLRSEVVDHDKRNADGLRTVKPVEWQALVRGGDTVVERFDLSGYSGNGVTIYDRTYELSGTFEAKTGLEAFGLKSTITSKCTARQSAAVKFELPGGRLYELRKPGAVSGFYFENPHKSVTAESRCRTRKGTHP